MIAGASIQQVISRADITEVIGQFIKLRRRGTNYIANCPFHNEKTPSFNVNPAKGIYKCFGCGKGGDVVSFIEEYEKFSFTEAIRWLAKFYQIDLQETESSDAYKQQQQIEESLRIVNEFAASYFEDILHQHEEGKIIGGGYFKERGFREEIIRKFRLGYCLDQWDAFTNTALAKGYQPELLSRAGLIKSREGGRHYDNYRGRVMFPVFSATGRIVGFGARVLKKTDHAPKYLNTPENELYVKSKILYGLYQSRQSIHKSDECLLVEGYTDVISLHQAGISNVVASSGTSLTEGQLKLIGNLTKNLTILYDGDAAGIKAALRGLDMALADSFNVKLVLLPEGEDPDSFLQKNGAAVFEEYIRKNKRDVIGFRLEVGLQEVGNDPVKKSKLVNEIAETISKISKAEDFSLQQHYIRQSALQLDIEEEGLIHLVNKHIRDHATQLQRSRERERTSSTSEASPETAMPNAASSPEATIDSFQGSKHQEEWQLIRLLLAYGDKPFGEEGTVAEAIFDRIDMDILEETLTKRIAQEFQHYQNTHGVFPDQKYFSNHTDKAIREKTAGLLMDTAEPSHNWMDMYKIEIVYGEKNYTAEVESSLAYFELRTIRKLLQQNLGYIEKEKDPAQIALLMKAHQTLKERERDLLQVVIVK